MLRTSVRLIAEARDEALDERMIAERNRTYFTAYQVFSSMVMGLLVGLLIFVITQDASAQSDSFNYQLSLTWPQVQALFWFIWGYAFMAPSMVMAWRESRKSLVK
jgi:ABC-type methionine transport system permease subunit